MLDRSCPNAQHIRGVDSLPDLCGRVVLAGFAARENGTCLAPRRRMDNETPRDDDPSGMTDFEKNTASEEREQLEQESLTPEQKRFSQEQETRGRPNRRA